jgi:hypothetical protein
MSDLAGSLGELGDPDSARQLRKRVLEVRARVLGEEHPDTLSAMNELAGVLVALGDYADARQLMERVLAVRTRVSGEEDVGTLKAMSELAGVLSARRLRCRAADRRAGA